MNPGGRIPGRRSSPAVSSPGAVSTREGSLGTRLLCCSQRRKDFLLIFSPILWTELCHFLSNLAVDLSEIETNKTVKRVPPKLGQTDCVTIRVCAVRLVACRGEQKVVDFFSPFTAVSLTLFNQRCFSFSVSIQHCYWFKFDRYGLVEVIFQRNGNLLAE